MKVKAFVFPLLLITLGANLAHAGWYNANTGGGSDIIMSEQRWVFWPKGTYFALWNSSTFPEGGKFYGGVATYGPGKHGTKEKQEAYRPQVVWTFWNANAYEGTRVRPAYLGAPFTSGNMSGEGASHGVYGHFPYLRPNSWIRMVMRAWPSRTDPDGLGYVGWWIKDVDLNAWHTVGVMEIPCKVRALKGNASFIENTGGGKDGRVFDRRLGYYRKDGQWHSSDQISFKARAPVRKWFLTENKTVIRYDSLRRDGHLDGSIQNPIAKHTVQMNQPDKPVLDKPSVRDTTAVELAGQVLVEWKIPQSSSPQLSAEIEVFGAKGGKGKPLATVHVPYPHLRIMRVDVKGTPVSVRLTVKDIFDQETSTIVPINPAEPFPAVTAEALQPGLQYKFYRAPKGVKWDRIPDMSQLTPLRSGYVKQLHSNSSIADGGEGNYALSYSGFVRAPKTGLYIFELRTRDGSRLKVDGKVVADNDGIHGPEIKQYAVPLAKGLHSIELSYFNSRRKSTLWMGMAGADMKLRQLTRADFLCAADSTLPSIQLTKPSGSKPVTCHMLLVPGLEMKGSSVSRIDFYRDQSRVGSLSGNQVRKDGTYALNITLPEGDNPLWARLIYDGGRTVDSDIVNFRSINVNEGGWEIVFGAEKDLPQGFYTSADSVSFSGEGSLVAYKKVKGDFVFTGRISDFVHATPDNGVLNKSTMGLFADRGTGPSGGFGMWDTAGKGLRSTRNDRDLETSKMNRHSLGTTDRWIRIALRGTRWIAFTSPDGKAWKKVVDRIVPKKEIREEMRFGVHMWNIPGINRTLFHGTISDLKIEQPGELPTEERKPVSPSSVNAKGRLLALVRGNTEATVMFARGNGLGVLKSVDAGESWLPVNKGLMTPDALAVRSIAVHPDDPSLVLRAGGARINGKLVSGLWKSVNGGETWKLVTREIEFDGQGPTGTFGETLAFSSHDTNLVVAGSETGGLYLSHDRGDTWENVGLKGERITCVRFHEKNAGLLVGTCADTELTTLGLGKPASPSLTNIGKLCSVTVNNKSGRVGIREWEGMPDFGITNIAIDSAYSRSLLYFATTRGLYYAYRGGLYQLRSGVTSHPEKIGKNASFLSASVNADADMVTDTLYTAASDSDGRQVCVAPFERSGTSLLYKGGTGYFWDPRWFPLGEGNIDTLTDAGVTSILSGTKEEPNIFYICNQNGIFKTIDNGKNYRRVYP